MLLRNVRCYALAIALCAVLGGAFSGPLQALDPSPHAVDFDGDGVSTETERLLFQAWVDSGAEEAKLLQLGTRRGGVIDLSGAYAQSGGDVSSVAVDAEGAGGAAALADETNCDSLGLDTNSETVLVDVGASWRYFKGTSEPPPTWKSLGFDDSTWLGPDATPLGFPQSQCDTATVLTDFQQGGYLSVYFRFKVNLTVSSGAWKFNSFRLRLEYDDGYVAYLNGQEIGRSNIGTGPVPFSMAASNAIDPDCHLGAPHRTKSNEWDSFGPGALTLGENIIAIQVHNAAPDPDSDFFFRPKVFAYKRGPFVARGTPTTTSIAFNTLDVRKGRVQYGTIPTNLDQIKEESGFVREHNIELTGLTAGTTYYYKVSAAATSSPLDFREFDSQTFCFDTPGTAPNYSEFSFVAFGDCGVDQKAEGAAEDDDQEPVSSRLPMLVPKPDFFLVAGDVIYEDGQRGSFDRRHFYWYRNVMPKKWFYQVLGNHDVMALSQIEPPFDFPGGTFAKAFVLPTSNNQEPIVAKRELYYSFDWGLAHVVILDATKPGSQGGHWNAPIDDTAYKQVERTWALNDLNSSAAFWKIVCLHHPTYSYRFVGGIEDVLSEDQDEALRKEFGAFFDSKVDLVVSGHAHLYERSFPLLFNAANPEAPIRVKVNEEPNYIQPDAPIYVVTGGGGRKLEAAQAPQPIQGGGVENFRAYTDSSYHVTRVSIQANLLTVTAIKHDGMVLNTASIKKRVPFKRGDADNSDNLNINESTVIFNYLFLSGPAPLCLDSADTEDSGAININDGTYLLNFLFLGGPPPPAPHPSCGQDPTADSLSCLTPTVCPL